MQPEQRSGTWESRTLFKNYKPFNVAVMEFEVGAGWSEKAGDKNPGLRFGLYPCKE